MSGVRSGVRRHILQIGFQRSLNSPLISGARGPARPDPARRAAAGRVNEERSGGRDRDATPANKVADPTVRAKLLAHAGPCFREEANEDDGNGTPGIPGTAFSKKHASFSGKNSFKRSNVEVQISRNTT
ncbi:hypothetical protein EYF80_068324 [Liparis tanakae]|uniref:Uncharacterized protein n=1 Tax=Liparis tanakae TaxID=230148 RepID=A0A4Z2DYF3_9TELE|nr:hypothetical protein EYF80_068324 [Liparis tanakae]